MKKLTLFMVIVTTSVFGNTEVPFTVPEDFTPISETQANEEFENPSLFSAGGYALKNSAGAIIYHVGNDVPLLAEGEISDAGFFSLFDDAEKLLPEPRFKIRKKEKFTEGSSIWTWIEGTGPHKGSEHSFIVAETASEFGNYDLWAICSPEDIESIGRVMREIIAELSTQTSNK